MLWAEVVRSELDEGCTHGQRAGRINCMGLSPEGGPIPRKRATTQQAQRESPRKTLRRDDSREEAAGEGSR
jgi:hypothetical protein